MISVSEGRDHMIYVIEFVGRSVHIILFVILGPLVTIALFFLIFIFDVSLFVLRS